MTATGSNDLGELWENYIITERLKRQEYLRQATIKVPNDWRANYPDAGFEVIHRENYLKFIQ